jgi:hypothetical protein
MLRHRDSVVRASICALAAATSLLACGDDDDEPGPTYTASCDKACAKSHECSSTIDAHTCATDCKNDAAAIGPNLSSAFLAGIDACVAELSCAELAAAVAFDICESESRARIAPSAAANDFCGAVVAEIQECVGISVGTAGCLETFKVFSDTALATAQLCQEKPCDQKAACVTAELGVDPTAPTG